MSERKYVFVYKENDTDDRDCVKYIDINDLRARRTDCINKFISHGACFCSSFKEEVPYEEITTVLSEEEYKALCNPTSDMDFEKIIDKLLSEENERLFEQIIEEEIEYLQEEFSLDREDIEFVFDNYYLDYRDRAIVGGIYEDVEELGREYIYSTGGLEEWLENYFDFGRFGEDLLDNDQYLLLEDGRVVYLMY